MPAGALYDSLHIAASTALMSLKEFFYVVVAYFDEYYISPPTGVDLIKIKRQLTEIGFLR